MFAFGTAALVGSIAAFFGFALVVAFLFRRVVEPNEVHIVQNAKGIAAYGANAKSAPAILDDDGNEVSAPIKAHGNAYYAWPSFLPSIPFLFGGGVQVKALPLAVFQLDLNNYEAYDVGKVPFGVDVVAFFRIDNAAVAARRITTLGEMKEQIEAILQGAVRTILAKHEIEEIMLERSTFGEMFTTETEDGLKAWGVENVKNIELMDIRDGRDSKTVSNIMAKKESLIDMQSRTEVATNRQAAEVAEIAAQQEVAVRDQKAQELVGLRTAEKEQQVGIANEKAKQEIKTQAKETKAREMAVLEVETVRQAEITKAQQIVAAEQDRETKIVIAEGQRRETVISAEATKEQTVLVAEGTLTEQQKSAEGTLAIGTAEAEAKKLAELATVEPQITLAQEIGENQGYQTYLIGIRNVEATEAVGVANAKALEAAGIKVIANTGTTVGDGVQSVSDLFTSAGGLAIGSTLEGLANTPGGKAALDALGVDLDDPNAPVAAAPARSNGRGNGAGVIG